MPVLPSDCEFERHFKMNGLEIGIAEWQKQACFLMADSQ
jgi:hypothetical protein